MGILALVFTIFLNAAVLIWLRQISVTPDIGLMVLALGYLPMASGFFISKNAPLAAVNEESSPWKWILGWSVGVTCVYTLFFKFPQFLSVSQLIVAQGLVPLVAVIAAGDFSSTSGRREPLRRLLPLALLLSLAWVKSRGGLGDVLSFVAICASIFLLQYSMRRLSRLQRPLWVLPRFALITAALTSAVVFFFARPAEFPSTSLLIWGAVVGIALILIQGGFLVGIAKTPPLLSALLISASFPAAQLLEWVMLGHQPGLIESILSISYVLAVAGQTFWEYKTATPQPTAQKQAA